MKRSSFLFMMLCAILLASCHPFAKETSSLGEIEVGSEAFMTDEEREEYFEKLLERFVEKHLGKEHADVEEKEGQDSEQEKTKANEKNEQKSKSKKLKKRNRDDIADLEINERSYVMDPEYTYVFWDVREGGKVTYEYVGKEKSEDGNYTWDEWMINGDKKEPIYYGEDETGVYAGFGMHVDTVLHKPIKIGDTYPTHLDSGFVTVTGTELEIETKAGKFKHVIELEWEDGWFSYIAPNVGSIKMIDEDGKTRSELIEMKKR